MLLRGTEGGRSWISPKAAVNGGSLCDAPQDLGFVNTQGFLGGWQRLEAQLHESGCPDARLVREHHPMSPELHWSAKRQTQDDVPVGKRFTICAHNP
jgi:hypothetical protein